MTSVLVVGGGPAGRALAAECAALGCATLLVDRAPAAPWRATYGAWLDELPTGLPPPAATAEGRVIAHTTHTLGRTYAVLDVPVLRAHLDERLSAGGVRIVAGRVTGRAGSAVYLADGTCLRADAIVDAGGHRAPLRDADPRHADPDHADMRAADLLAADVLAADSLAADMLAADSLAADMLAADGRRFGRLEADPPPDRDTPPDTDAGPGHPTTRRRGLDAIADVRHARHCVAAEQTAYGVVVDAAVAAPLVEPGAALFMDWRPDHGETGWPTFLYAIPLGGGAVLLEETSLARRPGLPLPVLRRRLLARLAHHGVGPPTDARTERVRFPVDRPRHATPGVLGFGAAAPLVHPASGFSVADALTLAPAVAGALASGGVPAARRLVWSTQARAVHRLRRIGLEAMLRMPPETVPDFFETFFTLPERHRRTYLSARDDLPGMLAAMGALFARADGRLRWRLVGPALRPPAPALPALT